jgi:hypothetical protein
MKRILKTVFALLIAPALGAAAFHEGTTQLSVEERVLLMQSPTHSSDFEAFWSAPEFCGTWHLLTWDTDHASMVPDAPNDLLDRVREEVGRVNQKPGTGDDLALSVTVFRYKRGGFLTNPVGQFELVARNPTGKAVWIAVCRERSSQSKAESLADSDSLIMARELCRKLRRTFAK